MVCGIKNNACRHAVKTAGTSSGGDFAGSDGVFFCTAGGLSSV